MKRKIDALEVHAVHAVREAHGEEGRVFEPSQVDEIAASIAEHGFVIVRLLSPAECDEQILEIWQRIILAQPFKEPLVVRAKNGRALDPVNDRAEFLAVVKGKLAPAQRRAFRDKWPLHAGFGASCDPSSFHRAGNYAIRQSPVPYAIAARILGQNELWCDVNRTIAKLPGEGEDEFLHWDLDAFFGAFAHRPSCVSGKVCFSASRFVAVPGTHTPAFQREFIGTYKELYPHAKPNAAKTGLALDKPDPLALKQRTREYHVPAGAFVVWNSQLLHGQKITPSDHPTEYGMYLSPARSPFLADGKWGHPGARARFARLCVALIARASPAIRASVVRPTTMSDIFRAKYGMRVASWNVSSGASVYASIRSSVPKTAMPFVPPGNCPDVRST